MTNEQIAVVQLVSTVMVTLANVVLAALTYRYVRLTRAMVQHMQLTRQASVVVDLAFDQWGVLFTVTNIGATAATDITFDVSDGVTWVQNHGLTALKAIQRGISYLPPGRTLKYLVGCPDWKTVEGSEALISIRVSYKTDGQQAYREFHIDMSQFVETSNEKSPIDKLAEVIERVAVRNRTRTIFKPVKKLCSECAEAIPAAARKCSHCGSPQPEQKQSSDTKNA